MEEHNVQARRRQLQVPRGHQLARPDRHRGDRVCVLNILGEVERRHPGGHAYSGGNVVFGTSPAASGQVLETPVGNVPVYNNVREVSRRGIASTAGVIYLPPSGARDGVAELIRVNPELKKIFIVTEKLSVHDSREIRAMGQQNGIDIFGGNSLGVADSWNQVRIGGALGGDNPAEALPKGSIAIFSNSGNFTTTIATYLRMAGWGTTTLISSGKDVYIHYAAPEFAFSLANDARTKAAVSTPSWRLLRARCHLHQAVVACVVGRWKSSSPRGRSCRRHGGRQRRRQAKEQWFMAKFGVDDIFRPRTRSSRPGCGGRQHRPYPQALTAVMQANAARPDFEPRQPRPQALVRLEPGRAPARTRPAGGRGRKHTTGRSST